MPILIFAAIVVFVVTYLLVLPAFTLDENEAAKQGGIDLPAAEEMSEAEAQQDTEKEAAQQEALAYEGDGYSITVDADAKAGLPEGTEITAEEVDSDAEDYQAWCDEALKALRESGAADDETEISSARFYDISLLADGEDIEPQSAVNVKISYDKAIRMKSSEGLRVVHFAAGEDGELKPEVLDEETVDINGEDGSGAVKVSDVAFEAAGFSMYALVGMETISTQLIDSTGKAYDVTVTYDDKAQIPEGASLAVTEYKGDTVEYVNARKNVIDSKKAVDADFDEEDLGLAVLEISILDKNKDEIEPSSPVTVSISMKQLPEGIKEKELKSTMEVQHHVLNKDTVIVNTVAGTDEVKVKNGVAEAEFLVDSFSTYTITWGGGQQISTPTYLYATSANTNAWYFDDNGASIGSRAVNTNNLYIMGSNRLPVTGGVIRANNGAIATADLYLVYTRTTASATAPEASEANSTFHIYFRTGNSNDTRYVDITVHYVDDSGKRINRTQTQNVTFTGTSYDTGEIFNNYMGNISGYANPHVEYRIPEESKAVTVHYGYMDGGTFKEFDELPEGAQTSYDGPTRVGDQLNVRYDIDGKDYVTTRINDPVNGTQISPLLQTEASSAAYWRYRVQTQNGNITDWQSFGSNDHDIYVIYRDTPTQSSTGVIDGLSPEDLEAPVTSKDVNSNNDGTYDIDLSVTGKSNQASGKSHANVVIVLDTSSSMNGTDTGQAGKNRLDVAKEAIGDLADQLFGFNTADDPKAIEVAFVNFSHRVRNEQTMNTIYSGTSPESFKNMINATSENGGTNYDTAIEAAKSILWEDADPVYVVFVTDGDTVSRGYMKYDDSGDGSDHASDWDGGTYYTGDTATYGDTYLERARSAAKIQVDKILATGDKFYSIGVFGNVRYLEEMGGTYLGQANEKAKIQEAFSKIISEIKMDLGYESVTIHDGITAMTSTSLVNGNVNEFHYSVTKDGVTTEYDSAAALQAAYPGIQLASYNAETKTVTWNMGDNYMLEDGVTYTVSFTVWPSQEAYDLLADLNNGIKDITEQNDPIKQQFFVQAGQDTYQFVANKGWTKDIPAKAESTFINDAAMKNLIDSAPGATYYLRTNTSSTVDYTSVKKVDGQETERKTVTGAEIRDPNGKMILDTSKMKVAKEFAHNINSADPYTKLNFYLKRDGKYYNKDGTTSSELNPDKVVTIELPKNGNWWDEIFIAPGLIEKEAGKDASLPPLETGHDYSVEEKIISGNVFEYEFTPQIVRPMVIGTTLTFLVKKDKYNTNPNDGAEYELPNVTGEGSSVYYAASVNNGSLIGTNRKTSELDITKVIPGVTTEADGQIKTSDPRYNESFTYRVKLSIPADGDPSGIMGYEYVPRLSDPVNNSTRVNIYGYQDDPGHTTYAPDTTRFKGKTYGAWNSQIYKYFVETYTSGNQTLVRRDDDGNFIWLQDGDGKNAAKKETINGKEYYSISLDVTIKMDEVYRFNNLPSGTKYEIQEIYWNKYKADNGSAARTIASDSSNIDDSGYAISINSEGTVGTTNVPNDTVSGTIEELDTRYYNQFVNTLGNPDIIQLKVTKHLEGYEWSGEKYYFRLSAINGAPMPPTLNEQAYISSASGSDDKSYAFGYIRFTKPGTYKYKITELDPATAGIAAYRAVDGVSGYGTEKTITITVDQDLKVTGVTGEDTTFEDKVSNTTFTNRKGKLVKLLKLGDNSFEKPLGGVTFELYEDEACTKEVLKDVYGNDIGTNGVITTSEDGMADIGTLKTGTYYLKETGTADGYNQLTELVTIEVNSAGAVTYNQPSYVDSNKGPDRIYRDSDSKEYYYSVIRGDESDAYAGNSDYTFTGYRIVVNNSSGEELPNSGGPGTTWIYLVGTILLLGCGITLISRRRCRTGSYVSHISE